MMARNVYMGPNSRAKIPVRGKVDTYLEILANAYATAFDAHDGWLLTRRGPQKRATIQTINGRFHALRILARKSAPRALPVIQHLHNAVVAYLQNHISARSYIAQIRGIMIRAGLPPYLVHIIEERIRRAERGRR